MLTSLQNPLVKQIRKLHRAKERREQNLCLLEGTHLLLAAYESNYPLVMVCCTPRWQEQHPRLWQEVARVAQRTEVVTPVILRKIATTVTPDGVVATAPRRTEAVLKTPPSLGLMLERLQDPGNLGTIIRTAVAAGADSLWMSGDSVDIDSPKVMRASAGEWFRLPIAASPNLVDVVAQYQSQGIQAIATLPQADKNYWEVDLTKPSLLVLGNEGAGLSERLASMADEQVKIPLSAEVESLNVAIAAALLLYEAQRQRWG